MRDATRHAIRSTVLAAALVLLAAVETHGSAPSTAAAARGTCSFGVLCGWIYNHDDHIKLMITSDWWRHRDRRTWRIVGPNSPTSAADARGRRRSTARKVGGRVDGPATRAASRVDSLTTGAR